MDLDGHAELRVRQVPPRHDLDVREVRGSRQSGLEIAQVGGVERIAQLERQLGGLRDQLGTFNEQVTQLEEELRRLKEIDLALPP